MAESEKYISYASAKWHLYREFITDKEAAKKAFRALSAIPAADVRPVVLCKDCKNWFMTPNGRKCYYAEWGIEDDDFCSCGEKREES